MAVKWLGLQASTAGGTGSIPARGTKISQALWHHQKKKKKKEDEGKKRQDYTTRGILAEEASPEGGFCALQLM